MHAFRGLGLSGSLLLTVSLVGLGMASDDKEAPVKKAANVEAADAIKPLPEVAIPDNPAPHEGAFFDLPYRIEPPDIVTVEVLEALPGRPISGERLVQPDGKISLGFYGDVYIRGLTARQAKVKIIHHLRTYMPDNALGLTWYVEVDGAVKPLPKPGTRLEPRNLPPPTHPDEPGPGKAGRPKLPENRDQGLEAKVPAAKIGSGRRIDKLVDPSAKKTRPIEKAEQPEAKAPVSPFELKADEGAAIDPDGQRFPLQSPRIHPKAGEGAAIDPDSSLQIYLDPADSSYVLVDVTAFNTTYYYVQGDVAIPGRLPITGSDTVLAALNYAAGFLPSADRESIHLYRPARAGKAGKDYTIDYEQILKGDKKANLQMFPGDRLVVGRKTTR